MPTVQRLSRVTLYVYADDHVPPHFHMRGQNSNALVDIESLQVIKGRYDRHDYAEAVAWASRNQDVLRQIWSDLNERD